MSSLPAGDPAAQDTRWAESLLSPGELALWRRMSGPDRRHAVGVARRVLEVLGPEAAPTPVLAAALLHDVGKVDAALGTWARVPATMAGLVARERAMSGNGKISRYLRHDSIGAALLAAAGAHPLTVAWAAEHHRPPAQWSVPARVGAALKAADDD